MAGTGLLFLFFKLEGGSGSRPQVKVKVKVVLLLIDRCWSGPPGICVRAEPPNVTLKQ